MRDENNINFDLEKLCFLSITTEKKLKRLKYQQKIEGNVIFVLFFFLSYVARHNHTELQLNICCVITKCETCDGLNKTSEQENNFKPEELSRHQGNFCLLSDAKVPKIFQILRENDSNFLNLSSMVSIGSMPFLQFTRCYEISHGHKFRKQEQFCLNRYVLTLTGVDGVHFCAPEAIKLMVV